MTAVQDEAVTEAHTILAGVLTTAAGVGWAYVSQDSSLRHFNQGSSAYRMEHAAFFVRPHFVITLGGVPSAVTTVRRTPVQIRRPAMASEVGAPVTPTLAVT